MRRAWAEWMLGVALGVGLFAATAQADAAGRQPLPERQSGLSVALGEELVYCDAVWRADDEELARALREGMEVALVWTIRVSRLRDWWLDDEVAEVRVERRVSPDLLTGEFLLQDRNSGIARRVRDPEEALAFLTRLRRFPVLDRALIEAGNAYEMTISIEERIGGMADSWWSRLWRGETAGMRQEFRLP